MLRNPRLRFHWDNGASDMMETSTLERYDKNVRNKYPGDFTDDKSPLGNFEAINVKSDNKRASALPDLIRVLP